MEAHDAAEEVRSAAEGDSAEHERDTHFRNRAAIAIAIMAALLAVTALLGQDSTKNELNMNVDAADTRSSLDARTTQVQAAQFAIGSIQQQLANPAVTGEQRTLLEQQSANAQAALNRLQSDPAEQDGVRELQDLLKSIEREQPTAAARGQNYDLAIVLFQIAIVLASVAILTVNLRILIVSLAVSGVALLLMLNGTLTLVRW
jgi:Flp pilus assembly protein TadB